MSEKPRRGIIVLSRIIRQGRQRIAELEAERDRYRKALERIANYSPPEMMSHKVWRWRINWLRDKARNALDAQKGGEG